MAHLDDRQEEALESAYPGQGASANAGGFAPCPLEPLLTLCDLEERDDAEAALQEVEALPPITREDLLRAGQGRLHFAGRWGPLVETLNDVSNLLELVEDSNDPLVRTGFLQTYGSTLGLVARYEEANDIATRQLNEAERFQLEWVLPHALEMRAVAPNRKARF